MRDLACMMGPNPATHHRHTGTWTDEAGLEEAMARAGARRPWRSAQQMAISTAD
jgi:hypothetical protein